MGGIGEIFTPLPWGRWAVREFGLLEKWLAGASILDPSMGDGVLLEALIAEAASKGMPPAELPLHRLFGVELESRHVEGFLERIRRVYETAPPPDNFIACDFLLPPQPLPLCDILFGNPPWATFADLPQSYKKKVRELFVRYGLVESRRNVLLGNSRVDLAALVTVKALAENLRPHGEAVFFLPMSLFQGGANAGFRSGRAIDLRFAVDRVHDLSNRNVFPGVATRYCAAHFIRDSGAGSTGFSSVPGGTSGANVSGSIPGWEPIRVGGESTPRQGVNTCGTNDLFLFTRKESRGDGTCLLSNRVREGVRLPERYVYPLAAAANFRQEKPVPEKWVFLPYTTKGKPLSPDQVKGEPLIREYLEASRSRLEGRRGVLVGSWIRRGFYWALLGVGPYSFRPWKILWESYGRREFRPMVFEGGWQANQALQCSMSFDSREDCERTARLLRDERVETYLRSYGAEGTMNWAQPGKIKKILFL